MKVEQNTKKEKEKQKQKKKKIEKISSEDRSGNYDIDGVSYSEDYGVVVASDEIEASSQKEEDSQKDGSRLERKRVDRAAERTS